MWLRGCDCDCDVAVMMMMMMMQLKPRLHFEIWEQTILGMEPKMDRCPVMSCPWKSLLLSPYWCEAAVSFHRLSR